MNLPPPPSGTPTDGLAFEVPANLVGHTSGKIVGVHYFTFPTSVSNDDPDGNVSGYIGDYWYRNWLQGTPGEGGVWTPIGGYTRDRPLVITKDGAPRPRVEADWKLADAADDVAWAMEAGIDVFMCDVLNSDAANENNVRYLKAAQASDALGGTLKVCAEIDTDGSIGSASASAIADIIAKFAYVDPVRGQTTGNSWRPSAFRATGGELIVMAWRAENKSEAWWQAVMNDLVTAYGISTQFWPVFLSWSASANYLALPAAAGPWGDGADPYIAAAQSDRQATVNSRGQDYICPVWAGDQRAYPAVTAPGSYPTGGVADEQRGTWALRAYWKWAIDHNVPIIQWSTWNDYREGCSIRPSVKAGRCWLDIGLYYNIWWKTGSPPAILRDCLYLAHRDQFITTAQRPALAAFRSGQTKRMEHWTSRNGEGTPTDAVEILSLLTAPANVNVTVGGNNYSYTAPAGVYSYEVPLALGSVSVSASRSSTQIASIVSPVTVVSNPYHDDWGPYVFSSLRNPAAEGQFDLNAILPRI